MRGPVRRGNEAVSSQQGLLARQRNFDEVVLWFSASDHSLINPKKTQGSGGGVSRLRATRRRALLVEQMEGRTLMASINEFPIPTADSAPSAIMTGPDGKLWFTESYGGQIEMIDPSTHAIAEFNVPTAGSEPTGITSGRDGNLWFTERGAVGLAPSPVGMIGMINPTTHVINEFPIPTADSGPQGITTGPDGNLWFTEFDGNKIGMINPATHAVNEFPTPTASSGPEGITTGADGNLWFAEFVGNNPVNGPLDPSDAIGMINHARSIAGFPVPTAEQRSRGIDHDRAPTATSGFTEAPCQPDRE